MASVRTSIDIEAPAQHVWKLVTDLDRLGEWVSIHRDFPEPPPQQLEQGTSFRHELQRVRMSHAAELLSAGTLPVASVARAVGYRQAAQFSKAFRRHHGHPPSAARMRGQAAGSVLAA